MIFSYQITKWHESFENRRNSQSYVDSEQKYRNLIDNVLVENWDFAKKLLYYREIVLILYPLHLILVTKNTTSTLGGWWGAAKPKKPQLDWTFWSTNKLRQKLVQLTKLLRMLRTVDFRCSFGQTPTSKLSIFENFGFLEASAGVRSRARRFWAKSVKKCAHGQHR